MSYILPCFLHSSKTHKPCSFVDKSVGSITQQLENDATSIQAFTGEPLCALVSALASITIGVCIAMFVSF